MTPVWRTLFLVLLCLFGLALAIGFVAWRHRAELAYLYVASPMTPSRSARPATPRSAPAAETTKPPPAPASQLTREPLSWSGLRVEPYCGRFLGDGEAMRSLGDLDQALLDGLKDLKDGSGIYPVAHNRAVFKPQDYQACAFREPFTVISLPSGDCRAEFAAEPIMLKWWAARDLFSAALCTVLLTEECTGYAAAPEWFRAGLALKISGLGPVYETRSLLALDVKPLQAIAGLGEGHDRQWLNGYWVFKEIEARRGAGAMQAILASLKRSEPWTAALSACGEDAASLDARYREWTTAYLEDRTANRETLLATMTLLREQHEDQAAPLLEAFVKEHPLDLYTGDARYWLGYAHYRLGQYEDASLELEDLLTNAPYSTSLQGKGSYFLGRCYQVMGYVPMALPQYAAAAREPDNPRLVRLAMARTEKAQ